MYKILLTGSTGFLGRHFKRHIPENWEIHESNTKIANLMDDKNLHIYNNIKFDYIFHFAAYTKAGDWPIYHKAELFELNQRINSNILKYWREFQPQAKFIAMGTSCSYAPDIPMKEGNYMLGEPEVNVYTYGMTKRMLLVGLRAYAEQYGLKYIYYIPSTLYGPDFQKGDTHFIFDLITKIYSGKKDGSKAELWGDGYQKRELIYIDDVIKIMLNTLSLENELLNVGTGNDHAIRDFADAISKIVGYNGEIFYDITKYVGVRKKKIDTNKLLKILPNFKFTPLNLGLKKTIEYYAKQ